MRIAFILAAAVCLVDANRASAQHLWWDTSNADDATCLYGEITVLATHPGIYYCGANWHPGEPAGGYCGIQHNAPRERRTIFSIWDTSPKLSPTVTEADPQTIFNRFGGEGEGAHSHTLWNWQVGETFQFFVEKQPGDDPNTTDTRYYFYDGEQKKWRHSATITSPNGDEKSVKIVATIAGGGLASFLENFKGTDREEPKLALYRLWLGTRADNLKCLTRAKGDGKWGQLHDAYFLAEGDEKQLAALYAMLRNEYGEPTFGKEARLAPLTSRELPASVVESLMALRRAAKVPERPDNK
jgi:hypothetical protein